ncbi:phytochrome-like protein cph1 [mine drainage metagenome]|uniref:histidine kinase n=1 Tax=mine drainage metagenome TaxID=410659 RepID=A0A1J5RHU4_9ZZZZ
MATEGSAVRFMGLKRRFALAMAAVFLAVSLITLAGLSWILSDTVSWLGRGLVGNQVQMARDECLSPLLTEIALARKMADSSLLMAWAERENDPELRRRALEDLESYRRIFRDGSYFFIPAKSNHYYFNDSQEQYSGHELRYTLSPQKPADAWYWATLKAGLPVQININPDTHLGVTKVWINVLMRDGGRVVGLVGTGLDLGAFIRRVVNGSPDGVETLFINQDGDIQAHRDMGQIDYASLTRKEGGHHTFFALLDDDASRRQVHLALARLAVVGTQSAAAEVRLGGHRRLVAFAPLRQIGWTAVSLIDRDRLWTHGPFLALGGMVLFGMLGAAAVIALLLDRLVLSRIARLDASAQALSRGEFELDLPTDTTDEIGRLSENFVIMAGTLHRHTEDLSRAVAEKEAEMAQMMTSLRISEERFRSLIEETSDWVWETDTQHRFTWLSERVEGALGVAVADLLGRSRWELSSARRKISSRSWADLLENLKAERGFRDFRYWVDAADGSQRWISISGSPRHDDAGHFLGYRGVASDITPEAARLMRLRLLSDVVEQCPVSILITNSSGGIEYANTHCLNSTGYDLEEVVGENPRLFSSGQMDKAVYAEMWGTVLAGRTWVGELRNRRRDGSLYWERAHIFPILEDDGRVARLVGIKEDITFQKEATARLAELAADLEEQAKRLKHSNAELEQFAYVTSHDLRQPLRMVSSYLSLIERELGAEIGEEMKTFIGFAVGGARRMDRLILDLLEYSRVGREERPFGPVDMNEVVQDACANLEVAIGEAGAALSVAPALPVVNGNGNELMRLWQNLIGNAVKYRHSERPCRIGIGAREGRREWTFWVQDNGSGIDPKDFDRAFGVFQRLVTKDKVEGTGIGLAICRKIVEHHGGRIWIEAAPEQGATFFFTLPRPS